MFLQDIMDGVVSLQQGGCQVRLHDKKIDHVAAPPSGHGLATGTARGNVSFWPEAMFRAKAEQEGLLAEAEPPPPPPARPAPVQPSSVAATDGSGEGGYGTSVLQVSKGSVRGAPVKMCVHDFELQAVRV